MDWNEAIKEWDNRIREKYTTEKTYEDWEGKTKTHEVFELPEQDITVLYNSKELCHYNGDYKAGCIKKAMLKTFTGTKKNREYQEIED